MADILHDFPIKAPLEPVFHAVSTPAGLDSWWTKRASGQPVAGAEYELWFGPVYDWRADVSRCTRNAEFELKLARAQDDWLGTHVGFLLEHKDGATQVRFHHSGWRAASEHYRISSFCWAMYLRLLKRYVELGEVVPYEDRLNV